MPMKETPLRDLKQLGARIPADLFRRLKVLAADRGRSVAELTGEAINDLLSKYERSDAMRSGVFDASAARIRAQETRERLKQMRGEAARLTQESVEMRQRLHRAGRPEA
jgi:predicted transcriptional regulator